MQDLDLLSPATDKAGEDKCVMMYNKARGLWTKVKEGIVVTVQEEDSLYLAAVGATDFVDLDQHLQIGQQDTHFRKNLRNEREYIRAKMKLLPATNYIETPTPLLFVHCPNHPDHVTLP